MEIYDIKELSSLFDEPEEFSIRTSEKVRKMNRYCDYWKDGKATTLYRNIQPYSNDELNTVDGWWKRGRKPKDKSYCFEMRSNHYGDWYAYCFVEDTRPFTDEEKEIIKENRKIYRQLLKEEKAKKEYENGPWRTSWQLLEHHKRKIKDGAIPRKIYNTVYDEENDRFYEADKAFYYYNLQDTEEVEDPEFQKLKASYIEKFGGWEEIDLENTTYNGKAWY